MFTTGTVVRGHQVASGLGGDPRYPVGTLGLQLPLFEQLGLPVHGFYAGTINIDISPLHYRMVDIPLVLNAVRWTEHHSPEDFCFFPCQLHMMNEVVPGLVYIPSTATKQEHFQDESTLEVLARRIPNLGYGDRVSLEIIAGTMQFEER